MLGASQCKRRIQNAQKSDRHSDTHKIQQILTGLEGGKGDNHKNERRDEGNSAIVASVWLSGLEQGDTRDRAKHIGQRQHSQTIAYVYSPDYPSASPGRASSSPEPSRASAPINIAIEPEPENAKRQGQRTGPPPSLALVELSGPITLPCNIPFAKAGLVLWWSALYGHGRSSLPPEPPKPGDDADNDPD